MQKTGQIDALHGLRGVAALLVLVGHFRYFIGTDLVPGNHLAVDLFFVLSGFVIAHAYDARLADEMGLKDFCEARGKRLYPLYVLALVISVVATVVLARLGATFGFSRLTLATTAAAGLFFLPVLPSVSPLLFPLNGPSWSLFWELMSNAVFAAIFPALTKRRLQILIALGAVAVALTGSYFGDLAGGAYWTTWIAGATRVWFSFFMGVYLRRFHFKSGAPRLPMFLGLVIGVVALMIANPPPAWRAAYDIAVVLAVWPLLILIASRILVSGLPQRLAHWSGEISYAIYVLHMPLIAALAALWTWRFGLAWNRLPLEGAVVIGGAVVLCATAAHYLYDVPVRRRLTQKRPQPSVAAITQF